MRKHLYSLILGPFCAFIFYSCSHQSPSVVQHSGTTTAPPDLIAVQISPPEPLPILPPADRPARRIEKKLACYAPPTQTFSFPAQEETLIICDRGSVLKFAPNSFVYADTHQPVLGAVSLLVTEYLTEADFIFAGLATRSNKEMLESGGMLRIDAISEGRICGIQEGQTYHIEIPAAVGKDGMELFVADDASNGTNWVPMEKGRYMPTSYDYQDMERQYSLGITGAAPEVSCRYPTGKVEFPGGIKKLYEYLHKEVVFPPGFENVKLNATSYINFTIDQKGRISKVYTPKQIMTYADKQVVAAFKKMPNWNADLGEGQKKKFMFPVKMDLIRDPSQCKETKPVQFVVDTTQYQQAVQRNNTTYASDRYLMESSQMGWINCDRFVQSNQPRVEFFVAADSAEDVTMRLVFHDIRSIMGGDRYSKGFAFSNIPKGEKATLVAVKWKNGKMEMAMHECEIDQITLDDLKYEPTNEADMRKQFSLLGEQPDEPTAYIE